MTQEDKNVTTLTKEIDAFKSMHPELLKTHKGLFVAIHNGKIIDHDKERFTLVKRIRASRKDTCVFIRQVTEKIEDPVTYFDSPETDTGMEAQTRPKNFLHWEQIYSRGDLNGVNVFRAKIAGGWLVLLKYFDSAKKETVNITFVPDTANKWSGSDNFFHESDPFETD